MMIDFEIPAEAQEVRERVRAFVQQECIPAEKELERRPYKEVLGDLRTKARGQGMWCPFIPKEHGGMGPGPSPTPPAKLSWAKAIPAPSPSTRKGPTKPPCLPCLRTAPAFSKRRSLNRRSTAENASANR